MNKGELILITGPMFAGKTTYLIRKIKNLAPDKVIIVKPQLDDRYRKFEIVTHNGESVKAKIVDETSSNSIIKLFKPSYSHLFIDELNFFSFNTVWPQIKFYLNHKVSVWASGLEYDYQQKIFGPLNKLRQYADKVIQLYAICDGCGGKANLSYRKKKIKGKVIVGGTHLYGACCPKCYPLLNKD